MYTVRLFGKLPEGYMKTVKYFKSICRFSSQSCAQPPNNPCNPPPTNPCIPRKPENAPKDPRVVIIGAGVAGLSAANQLTENGICQVKVLEASDRAGGRIHSCWLGDTVVELGAQWIEGACPSNSAFTLAAREGLLGRPFLSREDPSHVGLFYTSSGKPIEPWLGITAAEAYRKIKNEALSLTKRTGAFLEVDKTGLNLRQFINDRIMEELNKFEGRDREDASRVMFGLTNKTRVQVGEQLSKVSAEFAGNQIKLPGGNVRIPLGYIGLMAPLLRELPDGCVSFCKPVALVRWGTSGPDRAVVVTADGNEYPADYVIITVSLGVLKACSGSLFCPSLPAEKSEAISKLGFGRVGRLFLEYEKPFWVAGEGIINLAWSGEELSARRPDGCDWARGITGFKEVPSSNMPSDSCCIYETGSRVLAADISGPEAEAMERADQNCIAEVMTRLIRTFTGDPGIPPPVRIIRTSWCCDPNFRGGYSYLPVSSSGGANLIMNLSEPIPCCETPQGPIDPILLFAGEATHTDYFATVHGARLSGIREANRIIELTKNPE